MTSTAVATVHDEPKGIRALLGHEAAKRQILPFLRGANYEAVVQETILAVAKNPDLKKCDPASLVAAVATGVRWGGVIGEDIHLVPFGDKVTPMKDYKFKARKIVETGAARQVYGVAVYANEPFSFTQGTAPSIQHQVILDEAKRGKMVGAYAVAIIRAGQFQAVSKTLGEIDRIRQEKSKSWKKGEVPEWYAIKTVIHQLAKLLPQNAKLKAELEEEERIEAGQVETFDVTVAEPAPRPVRGVIQNGGYDVEPTDERDGEGRPIPRETAVTSEAKSDERVATSGGGVAPGALSESTEASESLDVFTGRPYNSAAQWIVPAGELRDRQLGSLTNDELVALREALGGMKKYAGTVDQIDNVLEDRREWQDNQ